MRSSTPGLRRKDAALRLSIPSNGFAISARAAWAPLNEACNSRGPDTNKKLEVAALVDLANRVFSDRNALAGNIEGSDDAKAIEDIIRVGTSAGGARAKAILAWNEKTGEFRSGQITAGEGFTYWLMKFDGVSDNRDREFADPQGFGLIEYAYHLMATDAGVEMAPCRLHREGGRAHFMTKRFDRTDAGEKLHMHRSRP